MATEKQDQGGDQGGGVFNKVKDRLKKDREGGGGDGAGSVKETRGRKTIAEKKRDEVIDSLYTPENLEGLVTLPFELRHAMTGWDGFELTSEEKHILAVTGVPVAKAFMDTDPKWIALTIFSITLLKLFGARELAYAAYRKEQKKLDIEKAAV